MNHASAIATVHEAVVTALAGISIPVRSGDVAASQAHPYCHVGAPEIVQGNRTNSTRGQKMILPIEVRSDKPSPLLLYGYEDEIRQALPTDGALTLASGFTHYGWSEPLVSVGERETKKGRQYVLEYRQEIWVTATN